MDIVRPRIWEVSSIKIPRPVLPRVAGLGYDKHLRGLQRLLLQCDLITPAHLASSATTPATSPFSSSSPSSPTFHRFLSPPATTTTNNAGNLNNKKKHRITWSSDLGTDYTENYNNNNNRPGFTITPSPPPPTSTISPDEPGGNSQNSPSTPSSGTRKKAFVEAPASTSSPSLGGGSMSCPSGQACSMGERRSMNVNKRGPEKYHEAAARPEEDITVIDDQPVLIVPVQEPESRPTTKISLPTVKSKVGVAGATKSVKVKWSVLDIAVLLAS